MEEISISTPGKCILFGEHAVVYGYTALVSTINIKSVCKIRNIESDGIIFNFPNFQQRYHLKTLDLLANEIENSSPKFDSFFYFLKTLQKIGDECSLSLNGIEIEISSSLWPNSGLGSSASTASAFIQAVNQFFNLKWDMDKINGYTYFMEKFIHGNPSGIDNTVINYGGFLLYQNKKFKNIKNTPRIPLLIINSGQSHRTFQAVKQVKEMFDKNPKEIDEIFQKIDRIADKSVELINNGDIEQLGTLMNQNQRLLERLNLSTPQISKIIKMGSSIDIYGVKITGAGLGGALIALGTQKSLLKYQEKLHSSGYQSIITSIGGK
ncbi:mevalonate kinase [Candidatus Harpocratesius sp.]